MDISAHILEHRKLTNQTHTPRIECKDGFSVSVQANEYCYCTPREDFGPYSTVELGYPNQPLPESFNPYCENIEEPLDTVYGYVPVDLVNALIESHGGIINT